jgi:hypothetical protein
LPDEILVDEDTEPIEFWPCKNTWQMVAQLL